MIGVGRRREIADLFFPYMDAGVPAKGAEP
jgi:hypothetical protein